MGNRWCSGHGARHSLGETLAALVRIVDTVYSDNIALGGLGVGGKTTHTHFASCTHLMGGSRIGYRGT